MTPNNSVSPSGEGVSNPDKIFKFTLTDDVPRLFIVWSGAEYSEASSWISADLSAVYNLSYKR
jgi:hypothetical protein